MPRHPDLKERFEQKLTKTVDSDCWMWIGTKSTPRRKTGSGYGLIIVAGKWVFAHRVAWILHNGTIPDGAQVLHRCDTPLCVNPGHLFLGTHADNMADKRAKGREVYPRSGELHWKAKLTEAAVRQIRSSHAPTVEVADNYGISISSVYDIKKFRSWRNVA